MSGKPSAAPATRGHGGVPVLRIVLVWMLSSALSLAQFDATGEDGAAPGPRSQPSASAQDGAEPNARPTDPAASEAEAADPPGAATTEPQSADEAHESPPSEPTEHAGVDADAASSQDSDRAAAARPGHAPQRTGTTASEQQEPRVARRRMVRTADGRDAEACRPEKGRRYRCPRICGQHEACIDARCMSTCRPACPEGTYCTEDGQCARRTGPKRDKLTEGELQARYGGASADSRRAVLLDVGGIIGLGIRPTYEWGAQHAFNLRYQIMNTGMMSHAVEPETEFERFSWGFGASFGYRRYHADWGNLRGFFYGAGAAYSVVQLRDERGQAAITTIHYGTPYGEFGYRWVFDHLVFGFGPAVSVRMPFFEHFDSLGEGSCVETGSCTRGTGARFEGIMTVEIGLLQ